MKTQVFGASCAMLDHLYFWPRVASSSTHVSITALISPWVVAGYTLHQTIPSLTWLMRGMVTLDLGLKHMTLQVPLAAADLGTICTSHTRSTQDIALNSRLLNDGNPSLEERVAGVLWLRHLLQQRREVVVKDIGGLVPGDAHHACSRCPPALPRVGLAAGPGHPGAQRVGRVELRPLLLAHLLHLVAGLRFGRQTGGVVMGLVPGQTRVSSSYVGRRGPSPPGGGSTARAGAPWRQTRPWLRPAGRIQEKEDGLIKTT